MLIEPSFSDSFIDGLLVLGVHDRGAEAPMHHAKGIAVNVWCHRSNATPVAVACYQDDRLARIDWTPWLRVGVSPRVSPTGWDRKL